MQKHSLKDWIIAVRPWSFPASAMPVMVTLGYVYACGHDVDWLNGLWALLNIVAFHAAGNTWSDYFDYRKQVDAPDTYGVRTLTSGQFAPREILTLSVILLLVAVLGGVGLLLRTGLPLLAVGVGGALCSLLYPALKYRALGDVVIFMAYALLPTLGTAYVATLSIDWSVMVVALPVGLITVAILHANNLRDIPTDRRARIRTFAMVAGGRVSVWCYWAEVLVPFVWLCAAVACGVLPVWTLLVLLAVVPAWGNVRVAARYAHQGGAAIARLDQLTAQLQLLFSLLLTVSFLLSVWL